MSKASKYAEAVKNLGLRGMWFRHPEDGPHLALGLTLDGNLSIVMGQNNHHALTPESALRLRDWLTENFDEEK